MSACDRPPVVRLTGRSASFSFIVDLTTSDITDLIYDGLGIPMLFLYISFVSAFLIYIFKIFKSIFLRHPTCILITYRKKVKEIRFA